MRWFYWAIFLVVTIVYLIPRLGWQDTIEFGYDQPRLASVVLDFARNGNFWDLQKYSLESPWGNFSWGPALVLFYLPILKFSANPINASLLIATFNLLSIVFVILIGRGYFSSRVGVLSGLTLALHPWWIVFSRMVYQPTPIPTVIAISIFLLFKTIEKPKSFWIGFLIFSWTALLQMYLTTFPFVLTSLVILVSRIWKKKISFSFLGLGLLFAFILFLPSLNYYLANPGMFRRFFEAGGKFSTSPLEVLRNFIQVLAGGDFFWQLGYGYRDFISSFPGALILTGISIISVTSLLFIGFLKIFKEKNLYAISLALFLVSPLWAIPLVGVEYVVPRYFLYVLPPFSLILAISFDELIKTFGKTFLVIPFLIFSWWAVFIFNYFYFIQNYNYPFGFLSHFSDVPYSFLQKSFDWIQKDAQKKGYGDFAVSDDLDFPKETRLNWAQMYYWNNLLKKNVPTRGQKIGHYLMYFSPASKGFDFEQFGPYVVYEYKGI